MRAAENLKTDENGVELLTIHRSKGLEFNTVYILGAADGSIPHDFALETARQGDPAPLEEERRLLYVAMTRPCSIYMYLVPRTGGEKQRAAQDFSSPFFGRTDGAHSGYKEPGRSLPGSSHIKRPFSKAG